MWSQTTINAQGLALVFISFTLNWIKFFAVRCKHHVNLKCVFVWWSTCVLNTAKVLPLKSNVQTVKQIRQLDMYTIGEARILKVCSWTTTTRNGLQCVCDFFSSPLVLDFMAMTMDVLVCVWVVRKQRLMNGCSCSRFLHCTFRWDGSTFGIFLHKANWLTYWLVRLSLHVSRH